jgi:hypothetical protein
MGTPNLKRDLNPSSIGLRSLPTLSRDIHREAQPFDRSIVFEVGSRGTGVFSVSELSSSTYHGNEESKMKRSIARFGTAIRLLTCLAVTTFVVTPVLGQGREVVNIPFSFDVHNSRVPLPSGPYYISSTSDFLALARGSGQPIKQLIITRLTGPNSFLQAGALVFDSTGEQKILSEVWLPGQTGILIHAIPKGHNRDVVSFSSLSMNSSTSGKTAFGLTYAQCHGQGGKGNPDADHYFGLTIPRLNSSMVQSKSDAELRAIITTGTEKMPPVEVEEGGFRHRLPPQDVDAVVAYLRTLKG